MRQRETWTTFQDYCNTFTMRKIIRGIPVSCPVSPPRTDCGLLIQKKVTSVYKELYTKVLLGSTATYSSSRDVTPGAPHYKPTQSGSAWLHSEPKMECHWSQLVSNTTSALFGGVEPESSFPFRSSQPLSIRVTFTVWLRLEMYSRVSTAQKIIPNTSRWLSHTDSPSPSPTTNWIQSQR